MNGTRIDTRKGIYVQAKKNTLLPPSLCSSSPSLFVMSLCVTLMSLLWSTHVCTRREIDEEDARIYSPLAFHSFFLFVVTIRRVRRDTLLGATTIVDSFPFDVPSN